MPLNIRKAGEPVVITSLVTMIYGQPGIGKTTLAFSANQPILLDFDRGSHRSAYRKDAAIIDRWPDASNLSSTDLSGYQTVVVDTVGRCLDMIADHVMANDPKTRNRSGALTLQGYGALKSLFTQWLKRLTGMGLDVVLVAHSKESKAGGGDDLLIRPDIMGGSFDEVLKLADLVGYQFAEAKQRALDFNPSDMWLGKNSAGLDRLYIPSLNQTPDYLAQILAQAKSRIAGESEAHRNAVEEISDWRAKVNDAATADDINTLVMESQGISQQMVKHQVKAIIAAKAKELGFQFDKSEGKFRHAA